MGSYKTIQKTDDIKYIRDDGAEILTQYEVSDSGLRKAYEKVMDFIADNKKLVAAVGLAALLALGAATCNGDRKGSAENLQNQLYKRNNDIEQIISE